MLDKTNHNRLAELTSGRLGIGGNSPPGPIDHAKEAMTELSRFLEDTPVIENFDQAKAGGGWVERTRIALQAMEDERKPKVDPLNAQLKAINEAYRAVREPLTRIYDILKARITTFNRAEEAKRAAQAERLRLEAEEAARIARAAEVAEQNAIAGADVGECTDVGAAIAEADTAFGNYAFADRQASRAERQVTVRIGSVMGGKALSMRTHEVFSIDDPCAAIKAMGCTDDIKKEIVKAAKKFRDAYGELPDGVTSTMERSL